MITQEKQTLYLAARQEIQSTGNKIKDVCEKYGLGPRAYAQWAHRQRLREEKEQVITLRPEEESSGHPKTVAIILGSVRFELQYSDRSELMEIVRFFRNV